MYRIATIAILGLAAAGPATAGSPTETAPDAVVAPVPAPVYADTSGDWAGAYGGVQLGYGSADFSTDIDDYSSDGIIGGAHVGYMWDFGDWVVGPEFQYDATDLDISTAGGSGSFDEIARLNLRVGRDLGRGLVYGTAGLAYANFDGVSGALSGDLDDPGYTLGVGYDYQLTDRWTVGGQYQYHKFDDFGASGNDVDFGTAHLRASFNF